MWYTQKLAFKKLTVYCNNKKYLYHVFLILHSDWLEGED